jgi:hypothetical protein
MFLILVNVSLNNAANVVLIESTGIPRPNELVSIGIPLKMGEIPNQKRNTDYYW